MAERALETRRQINLRNWWLALYTIPKFQEGEYVDPVTRWLIAMRAAVLVMTVISGLLGGLLAAVAGKFDLGLLLLTTLGLTLAHAASNLINDFWDARHGLDTADSPRVNYGPQAFVNQEFTARQLLTGTGAILALAALIGLYLTLAAGPVVALFAVAGAAILLFYSGDPFPLKYRGLGELAVLIVWGPLMVGGTYYIQTRELPLWVIAASLPYAIGVTTVLFGKHLDKLDFDRLMGIKTFVVLIGEKNARDLTIALVALMYVITVVLVLVKVFLPTVLLVLFALPLAMWVKTAYSFTKPDKPPIEYVGWPLWFVGFTFVHNRRFGSLYLLGILLHILLRAFVLRA
jgi:1,4-dihydroxy-2-naphthoate octaprenyltransferase